MQVFGISPIEKIAKIKNMQESYNLGNNNIGDKGCKYIASMEWKKLKKFSISIRINTQAKKKSEMMDVGIYHWPNGRNFKSYKSVTVQKHSLQ